jgi:hypothetical protein
LIHEIGFYVKMVIHQAYWRLIVTKFLERNKRSGQAEEITNATHLHLMLNHIPVIGTDFALLLLLAALAQKSDERKKAIHGLALERA